MIKFHYFDEHPSLWLKCKLLDFIALMKIHHFDENSSLLWGKLFNFSENWYFSIIKSHFYGKLFKIQQDLSFWIQVKLSMLFSILKKKMGRKIKIFGILRMHKRWPVEYKIYSHFIKESLGFIRDKAWRLKCPDQDLGPIPGLLNAYCGLWDHFQNPIF